MNKVFIYAYTASNLGDDLFIQTICTRYPETQFYFYAPKVYRKTFAKLNNLKIIPSDEFLTKLTRWVCKFFEREHFPRETHAKKCDIGIYVGGSIFAEHEHWPDDIHNLKSMLRTHDKLFILSPNFGPSKTEKFITTYGYLFSKATDVCFRDRESVQQFEYLPNVRQAADVVFQLPADPSKETSNNIVISVINPAVRKELATYETAYINKLAEIAESYITNGATITLMSFCESERDQETCGAIYQQINPNLQKSISTFHYNTNISEALSTIAQSQAIIATRFHAMILGWIFNKPVFPIIYSKKMKNVMNDNLFPGKYVDIQHITEIDPETVYNALKEAPFEIEEIKQSADSQFAVLDRYLVDRSAK